MSDVTCSFFSLRPLAIEVTTKKVIAAYVAACQRYDVKPLEKVIQQLQVGDS